MFAIGVAAGGDPDPITVSRANNQLGGVHQRAVADQGYFDGRLPDWPGIHLAMPFWSMVARQKGVAIQLLT